MGAGWAPGISREADEGATGGAAIGRAALGTAADAGLTAIGVGFTSGTGAGLAAADLALSISSNS